MLTSSLKSLVNVYQQVSFSYDLENFTIIDPVQLAKTLRQFDCIQLPENIRNLQKVRLMCIKLTNARDHLLKDTSTRFEKAFESREPKALKDCIKIYFQLEALREQIQTRVNQTLKSIS